MPEGHLSSLFVGPIESTKVLFDPKTNIKSIFKFHFDVINDIFFSLVVEMYLTRGQSVSSIDLKFIFREKKHHIKTHLTV